MRKSQIELLEAVKREMVGWRMTSSGDGHYGEVRSFRLWTSETDSTVVTDRMRRLVDAGLVTCWPGVGVHGQRGGVDLTSAGRRVLLEAGK